MAAVGRLLVSALIVAVALGAAAPFASAEYGSVTVRIVGAQDGKGTFTVKGAFVDTGKVVATSTKLVTRGKKGTLTFSITNSTWRIASGTKTYAGLYGHGKLSLNCDKSLMTLTGTVERPRQPSV
jgi:hypothetical protein